LIIFPGEATFEKVTQVSFDATSRARRTEELIK
jgi:hypothetical protein